MLSRGVRLETVSRLLGNVATTVTDQAHAQLTDHRIRTEVEEALSTGRQKAEARKTAVALTVATNSTTDGKLVLRERSRTTARPNGKTKRTTLVP